MLAMHDGRSRALLAQIRKFDGVRVVKSKEQAPEEKKSRSPAHTAFMVIHYTMTYPTVMNLVLIAALLNFFIDSIEWRVPLLIYLTFGSAIVTAVFITRTISKKTIEEEFQTGFEPVPENPQPHAPDKF